MKKDFPTVCCAIMMIAAVHIPHSVLLLNGFYEKAEIDQGGSAHLIEHYLTFVGKEWNSPLITDIYLETGKDKFHQKSCVEPLFERVWGGIVPYSYTEQKVSLSGHPYDRRHTVTLGP